MARGCVSIPFTVKRQNPGPGHFFDSHGFEKPEYGVDFFMPARDLDDVMGVSGVHDFRAERIDDPLYFRPVFLFGLDADDGHFPLDRFLAGHVPDFYHVDQPPDMLHDLLQLLGIGFGRNGDPGHLGIGRGRAADGFDIVAPAGKEA